MNPADRQFCQVCESPLDVAPEILPEKRVTIDERLVIRVGLVVAVLVLIFVLVKVGGLLKRNLSTIQQVYHSDLVEDALGER